MTVFLWWDSIPVCSQALAVFFVLHLSKSGDGSVRLRRLCKKREIRFAHILAHTVAYIHTSYMTLSRGTERY